MKIRIITDELIVGDAVKVVFPKGTYLRGQEIEVDPEAGAFACSARWAEAIPEPDPIPIKAD